MKTFSLQKFLRVQYIDSILKAAYYSLLLIYSMEFCGVLKSTHTPYYTTTSQYMHNHYYNYSSDIVQCHVL